MDDSDYDGFGAGALQDLNKHLLLRISELKATIKRLEQRETRSNSVVAAELFKRNPDALSEVAGEDDADGDGEECTLETYGNAFKKRSNSFPNKKTAAQSEQMLGNRGSTSTHTASQQDVC